MKRWLCLLLIPCSVLVSAQVTHNISWGAGMRNGKLIVALDTKRSPANLIVEAASFNAEFYDAQGRKLGPPRNFALPPGEIRPGGVRKWDVPHPFPQAASVSTDRLLTTWHPEGSKTDEHEVESSTELIDASAPVVVIQPPPPAERCVVYGRRAVQQFQRWTALSCGAADSRWDGNFENHAGWCRSQTGNNQPEEETSTRDGLLRRCIRLRSIKNMVR